jgi:multicomponent K+:H+ antiporter subunit A
MSDARLLALIVLLPFAGVMIPVLLARRSRTTIAWASGLVPLVAFGLLVHLGRRVFAGEVITASRP